MCKDCNGTGRVRESRRDALYSPIITVLGTCQSCAAGDAARAADAASEAKDRAKRAAVEAFLYGEIGVAV